jgi:hypothetical protein
MEYLVPHSGRNGSRFVYELAFDGDASSDAVQMIGLMNVAALAGQAVVGGQWPVAGESRPSPTTDPSSRTTASPPTTATSRGESPDLAGGWRAAGGALAVTWRGDENPSPARSDADSRPSVADPAQNALFPENPGDRAHRRTSSLAAAS